MKVLTRSHRASEASREEIERIYRAEFHAFLFTLTAVLGDSDAAFDAVQSAFARALRERKRYRGDGTVAAWLWRIALNTARDERRRRRRAAEPRAEVEIAANDVASGDSDELRRSVMGLPERQRITVFLRYYGDLSYAEIAGVLGVSPGTVAASLNAAHRALRTALLEVPNEPRR